MTKISANGRVIKTFINLKFVHAIHTRRNNKYNLSRNVNLLNFASHRINYITILVNCNYEAGRQTV